jgi:hypothetical protein
MRRIDLIEALAHNEPYEVIVMLIGLLHEDGNDVSWDVDKLKPAPQAAILAMWFDGEINNGGFVQYLTNPTGRFALETLDMLRAIGAEKSIDLLESALTIFPNGIPSKDDVEREHQVQEAGEEAWKLIKGLTSQYYSLFETQSEDVPALAVAYIRGRIEDFDIED